ncbi:MAG: alpha/beta fold hydrolase [Ardenticatenales bacterium]|nr:alpha/beta fold hydrolase [Ardenticatenales bacterium]
MQSQSHFGLERSTHRVNGLNLATFEIGDRRLQTCLLIHGWSSSAYAMSPLMAFLCQRFYCVAVDLPGYGDSDPLPERVTIDAYAEVLAGLIGQLSREPVVVVGHSMGGMIGVTLALHYPEVVERMVLVCPTITGQLSLFVNTFVSPVTMLERFGFGSRLVAAVERSFMGVTDRFMRPASFAERTNISEEAYNRLRADARRKSQGPVRAECFWAMRNNDLSGQLGEVKVPALVICGAEDNTVPLRDTGIIADEWPEADLRILPKAGHWPHFERAADTQRIISAYLGVPRFSDKLKPVTAQELVSIQELAGFLAHSDVGTDLNLAQRTRLAAQFRQHLYKPGENIALSKQSGQELFLIQYGTVEVWRGGDENGNCEQPFLARVATLRPGQITGEMAMLDDEERSADLVAGPKGAVVLSLSRERLLALCEDDAVLGTRLLWNIARAMSQRIRFVLWQMDNPTTLHDTLASPP